MLLYTPVLGNQHVAVLRLDPSAGVQMPCYAFAKLHLSRMARLCTSMYASSNNMPIMQHVCHGAAALS